MNIYFRLATIADLQVLSILKKQIWFTTYKGIYKDEELENYNHNHHEQKFKKYIENGQLVYLILNDQTPIGYFSIGEPRYKYKNHVLSLNSLYILNDYQKMGIGKKVFEFIFDYCKKANLKTFYTCCNMYNNGAYQFYLKMGGECTHFEKYDEDKASHQYYIEFYL